MSKPIVRISQDLSAKTEEVAPKTEERNGGSPDTQNDLKHDLMKVHDLLTETQQVGFRGVQYKTQKDANERLTVTITFPSPSEIAQMRAQQAAAGPSAAGAGVPAAPAPNISQMPAGGSAAPAAPAAPAAIPKAAGSLSRLKYADIQLLKNKYPNGFLKAMGI